MSLILRQMMIFFYSGYNFPQISDEGLTKNLLNLVQFSYLGLHKDIDVVPEMKERLEKFIPAAVCVCWQQMKVFALIEELPEDIFKLIFFVMLFECKSINWDC